MPVTRGKGYTGPGFDVNSNSDGSDAPITPEQAIRTHAPKAHSGSDDKISDGED